jgi:Circularly permutated YpsA SLOG family
MAATPKTRKRLFSAVEQLQSFVSRHAIQTLNVAGPRESEAPGLGGYVKNVLATWLQTPAEPARY